MTLTHLQVLNLESSSYCNSFFQIKYFLNLDLGLFIFEAFISLKRGDMFICSSTYSAIKTRNLMPYVFILECTTKKHLFSILLTCLVCSSSRCYLKKIPEDGEQQCHRQG